MSEKSALISSVILLFIGGMIYICFRSDSLLLFHWISFLGFGKEILELRDLSSPYSSALPNWLIYSAPNGLWIASFACLMLFLWGKERLLYAFMWTLSLWVTGIFSELLQALNSIPGVYDIADIIAYTIGICAVFFIVRLKNTREVNLYEK